MRMRFALATFLLVCLIAQDTLRSSPPVAASQERDPEIVAALGAINLYRKWIGVAPLTIDPALQRAAEAHVEYYRLNFGDPDLAGMGLHYETIGKPGFTGEDFQERANAAGYDGWVNENAGLSGSMLRSVDWFMATVGHRLTLLDPRYKHIGIAAINSGDKRFEIIDLGAPEWIEDTTPEWVAWPPDGSTGVDLRFDGEAPNPFPGASYPVGYPISLKYFGPGEMSFSSATLSSGGKTVPSFAEIGTGWLSRETVLLCAEDPLTPGATYDVEIRGTANGKPFTRNLSFTTTTGDDPLALNGETAPLPIEPPVMELPPGLLHAEPAVQEFWWSTDGPVAERQIERSWLWGPDVWHDAHEPYLEAPGGARQIYYFDKGRIEVNETTNEQFLTAGLLVRDMIAGVAQVGDNEFVPGEPANVPLAGDELAFNPNAPTYASLTGLASTEAGREVAVRTGEPIVETLSKAGFVAVDRSLAAYATYGSYDPTLGHNIAAVFDAYIATLPAEWWLSVGLPLTEPYWVRTNLAGEATWVLVQAFERRILTYTPVNRPEWRVEMGNAGRHYYAWRYGVEPPDTP